jgi:hypothetical protein
MGESDDSNDPRDMKRYDNNGNFQRRSVVAQKIGTLDNGTTAFMQWLDLVNNQQQQHPTNSLDAPLILRKFIKDKQAILYDKNLESEINVEIKEGVPFCSYCDLPDCSHVGFAISLEQLCEDRCSNQELSTDDIVGN